MTRCRSEYNCHTVAPPYSPSPPHSTLLLRSLQLQRTPTGGHALPRRHPLRPVPRLLGPPALARALAPRSRAGQPHLPHRNLVQRVWRGRHGSELRGPDEQQPTVHLPLEHGHRLLVHRRRLLRDGVVPLQRQRLEAGVPDGTAVLAARHLPSALERLSLDGPGAVPGGRAYPDGEPVHAADGRPDGVRRVRDVGLLEHLDRLAPRRIHAPTHPERLGQDAQALPHGPPADDAPDHQPDRRLQRLCSPRLDHPIPASSLPPYGHSTLFPTTSPAALLCT